MDFIQKLEYLVSNRSGGIHLTFFSIICILDMCSVSFLRQKLLIAIQFLCLIDTVGFLLK